MTTFAALPYNRIVPLPVKLRLRIGPAQTFAEVSNDRTGWHEIANRLHDAVLGLSAINISEG